MINCPVCNAQNQAGALFCEMCGNRLPSANQPVPVSSAPAAASANATAGSVNCPTCGHPAVPGEAFCEECGTPLPAAGTGSPITGASTVPNYVPTPPSQPAPQPSYPAPTPLAPAQSMECPQCHAPVLPGEAFCDACGAALTGTQTPVPAPSTPAPVPPAPVPAPVASAPVPPSAPVPSTSAPPPASTPVRASLGDFRLQFSDGNQLPLPDSVDIVIGREDTASNNYPDIDLTPQGGLQAGVGRRHARMYVQGDQIYLEDLDSTNGTMLNRQKLPPHQKQPLKAGDEIRLGKLVMTLAR